MSRDIKFRVWSLKHKQWMNHCAVIDCPGNIGSHFVAIHDDGKLEQCFVGLSKEENIIQQFTGLKDKNDKDIFEGDILKVSFPKDNSSFIKQVRWLGAGFDISPSNEMYNYEVIGNIFETPELL